MEYLCMCVRMCVVQSTALVAFWKLTMFSIKRTDGTCGFEHIYILLQKLYVHKSTYDKYWLLVSTLITNIILFYFTNFNIWIYFYLCLVHVLLILSNQSSHINFITFFLLLILLFSTFGFNTVKVEAHT